MNIIKKGAVFNSDRTHRYVLWRIWDVKMPKVLFIGLNPSTADEYEDDPTLKRVIQFAKDWGYGGVFMCNVFSFITPYPKELDTTILSLENMTWMNYYRKKSAEVVCAWGAHKEASQNARRLYRYIRKASALQMNRDGSPRHPLYVKAGIKRIPFVI